MFKISDDPTFAHTIKARVPVDGGFDEQKFKATYKVIPVEEIETFDLGTVRGSTEFLLESVVRLDEIADAKGKALEYNDELLKTVISLPYARAALLKGYIDGVSGARSGN